MNNRTCELCSMQATHTFIDPQGLVHWYCHHHAPRHAKKIGEPDSLWITYKPLIVALGVIFLATGITILMKQSFSLGTIMNYLMGYFFLVFGFTKVISWKNFAYSFRSYDPLAKKINWYSWIYPGIEIIISLLFLSQYKIIFASWMTLVILSITTIGIIRSLYRKETLQCVCLGTWFSLPLGWVTVTENAFMIIMAIFMIVM